MHNVTSRILRIGVVNSGMFDLLELNTDVRALHLVGENNVGKTSLIELTQFLYFHQLPDMTFSKPLSQTLAFYFRREGSYLLFEVRTLRGTRRTVGIYGTGTAHSREIFVFDGGFELDEFLDAQRCPLPLDKARVRFFDRHFYLFDKAEHYEKALLGQHTNADANVQLFDLSMTNFRLLRQLLQGLLRLERLTAADVQSFLIKVVETGAVKTSINISQDFERKHRDIKDIQNKLAELRQLEPVIRLWQSFKGELTRVELELKIESDRLFHLSERLHASLARQRQAVELVYTGLIERQRSLQVARDTVIEQRTEVNQRREQWRNRVQEFAALEETCAGKSSAHVTAERDACIHQRLTLQRTIAGIQVEQGPRLRQQFERTRKERDRIQRQKQHRTVEDLWREARFSEQQIALLRFLIAERVLSLPVQDHVADPGTVLASARRAFDSVDADGTFRGFGLTISRTEWFTPLDEQESFDEQLARVEQTLKMLEDQLAVVEHREEKQRELQNLQNQIEQHDELRKKLTRYAELCRDYGSPAQCQTKVELVDDELRAIKQTLAELDQQVVDVQGNLNGEHVRLNQIEGRLRTVSEAHTRLQPATISCPDDIHTLSDIELVRAYDHSQGTVNEHQRAARQRRSDLQAPESQLRARYDHEAPTASFAQWVVERLDITNEIQRIERQLADHYQNLLTLVRGELDKLLRAFEVAKGEVAKLNTLVRRTSISNIEHIELAVQESALVTAIRTINETQMDLFSAIDHEFSFDEAQQLIDDFLVPHLSHYGRDIHLRDMFHLQFAITFVGMAEPRTTAEIHRFESNGTATGIKIVLYLGLLKLLQGTRRGASARMPFFLDEVGTISSNNLRQIIAYCEANNFLPMFASPTIRNDISHNYILRRQGERTVLVNEVILTERELEVPNAAASVVS